MAEWTNPALLLAEALLYFAVMAGLFRIRHRFGIGLVFTALGAMHFLETYLAAIVYLELPGGLVLSPGSIVLFCGKLAMLLLVYIREDASAVRQPIYGLLVGNFLMVALVFLMRFHDVVPVANGRPLDFRLMDEMGGLMIWGTILLFIDSILIILLYERTGDWFGGQQLPRVILSAAIVLTFDQLGFFTALYLLSGVPLTVLYGGWIAKMGAAVLFGLMTAFYLRYVETAGAIRGAPRLSDVFDALTYRQRRETEDRLGRDSLTGLLDRGRFDSEGRSLVNDAALGKRSLSLMVIDIDKFSAFNERHGRTAGSEALRLVANLVRQTTRETDRVYRYGDEEIVVLCDGLAHSSAVLAAERLRRRIATALADAASPVTVSVGLSTAPLDGTDLASLLEAADQRLFTARAEGGNQVVGHPQEAGGKVSQFPRHAPI